MLPYHSLFIRRESPTSTKVVDVQVIGRAFDYEEKLAEFFPGVDEAVIDVRSIIDDPTPQGIRYFWELSGPGGAWFCIFPEPHHTEEDIRNAKDWLRGQRDVTGIGVRKLPKSLDDSLVSS